MANSFPVLKQDFSSENEVIRAEHKALSLLGSRIRDFQLSQCDLDSELIKLLQSFLISCQNIKILAISHIGSKWSENAITLCQTLQFSFPFLKDLR